MVCHFMLYVCEVAAIKRGSDPGKAGEGPEDACLRCSSSSHPIIRNVVESVKHRVTIVRFMGPILPMPHADRRWQ